MRFQAAIYCVENIMTLCISSKGEHFIQILNCIMAIHMIAVSQNRLDSSNYATVNNTRMLYRYF